MELFFLMNSNPTIIVLAGPTAVGKTAMAIELAKYFKTIIINADSRQCYKELNIGVAKPSMAELEEVKHFFVNTYSIQENITAATFETYALACLSELFKTHQIVVVAGGTGLYIKALCEGLDEVPSVAEEIRQDIITTYEKKGILWLQETTAIEDPLFWQEGEIQNPQRLMRALEVKRATGKSIVSYKTGVKKERSFNIIKIGLELPRELLNESINKRVEGMMRNGLLEEVQFLIPFLHLNALQTVGYTELFNHLAGNISYSKAVDLIKTHTRQYAKRQMTWFKKDSAYHWYAPSQLNEVIAYINKHI
jgi:tRNA dimethylallyltransferase